MRVLRDTSLIVAAAALTALILLPTGAVASQARPKPSPTPTPTPSPTPTPTPSPPSGWSIVGSPNPDPNSNKLHAVAAISGTDVWAVGQASTSTLAEHWNGSSWTAVPTPNAPGTGTQSALLSVAAVTSSDVWSVGFSANGNTSPAYATLAEHWNGSAWSIVPTPTPSGPAISLSLNALAAISSSDVWAVGGAVPDLSSYGGKAILEHWNGSAWSIVSAPAGTENWSSSSRFGAAAVASNNVWAVGDYDSFHWDATSWSVVFGAQSTVATSASGANNVWAVGSNRYYDSGCVCYYGPYTLAFRWNGTSWVQTSSLSPTGYDTFQGTAAFSSSDVWAVGTSGAPGSALTLTEHWDGSSWSVVPSANASTTQNVLDAVAAVGNNDVWAVGYYATGTNAQLTLVEHFTG